MTTREATAEQDGIQENRCSCGLVQDTAVISAGQVILQKFYDMVRNAPANGTVSYDSGSLHTLSDEDAFYGYFYFAQQTGAKIEPVA